ncbi:hypothetical protein C8J57DRAFT_686409, partial [Mycena rebaudengoi]
LGHKNVLTACVRVILGRHLTVRGPGPRRCPSLALSLPMSSTVILLAILLFVVFTRRAISRHRRSIARVLGPHATSWVYGNMPPRDLGRVRVSVAKAIRTTVPHQGLLWSPFFSSSLFPAALRRGSAEQEDRLVVSDPRALQHTCAVGHCFAWQYESV